MTESAPINEDEEIAAARSLVADDWTPYCLTTPRRGLDVRDWKDAVRVLLKRLDAKDDPEADGTDYAHPAWWRGEDSGVYGASVRWDEALTKPIPTPGVMNEPLESLYRRTEALRTKLAEAEARAKKCEDDWNLDLLKHTTQIRAERDAEVVRRTSLERQCIAILKAHGIDPSELGLRGDNER